MQANEKLFAELDGYQQRQEPIPDELMQRAIQTVGPAKLLEVQAKADALRVLDKYAPDVLAAQERAPDEWERWWWFTIACQALFLPTVFLMAGRWDPRKARADAEEHARKVDAELAELVRETAESER